jgi:predicted small integral membrane protein
MAMLYYTYSYPIFEKNKKLKGNIMIRYIKIAMVLSVSLFCLMYALQNIANLDAANWFVSYTTSMEGHEKYPAHFGPAVTAPVLHTMMLWIIIALEISAGLLAAKGAFDLFTARNSSADEFNSAKNYAIAGCGVGILVWFGLFSALGGAYFQMWQTEAGGGALANATWFSIQLALVWILVSQKDN